MVNDNAQQHIDALQRENAELRAMLGKFQGPLHPPVEPQYHNGSVVCHADGMFRVVGRAIEQDGTVTYTLQPIEGDVVHVSDDSIPVITRKPVTEATARDLGQNGGRVTYDLAWGEGERVFDVPEGALEPYRPEDMSLGTADHAADTHVARLSEAGGVTVSETP